MNITPAQHNAAGELVDLIASSVGKNRAVHPETAIASAARLSGSLLFRSFNLHLKALAPGAVVLSQEANEKGPILINTVASFLSTSGVSLDQQKLGGQETLRGESPRLDVVDSLSQLQERAFEIMANNHLSLEQAAQAAALATGFIVKECAAQIGAEIGFNVAAYGFVEGCKTVPPTNARSAVVPSGAKPWYKFW